MSANQKDDIFIGMDIGSAHLKITYMDSANDTQFLIFPVGVAAAKVPKVNRLKGFILPIIGKLLEELRGNYRNIYVNITTSLEVSYPYENYLQIFKEFIKKYEDIQFFIMSDSLKPIEIKKIEEWPLLSTLNSLRYLAPRFVKEGLLIHMNSSSTLFIPVKKGNPFPLEKNYSSGVGMWCGALYRLVFNVTNGIYIFGRKAYISPTSGSLSDMLLHIKRDIAEKMLKEHNAPFKVNDEYIYESDKRLYLLFGIFNNKKYFNPFTGENFNLENQIKISCYHTYMNFLHALMENALKIISALDIHIEKSKIVLSGIGEPILEDAFNLFKKKELLSSKLSRKASINLESYGAAMSLLEMLEGGK